MLWRRRIRYLNNCFFLPRAGIRSQSKPNDIMGEVYRAMMSLGYVSIIIIHSESVANQFTKICWTSSILQVEIICLQGEGKLTSVERNSMTHCLCLKFVLEGIRLLTEQYLRFIAFRSDKCFLFWIKNLGASLHNEGLCGMNCNASLPQEKCTEAYWNVSVEKINWIFVVVFFYFMDNGLSLLRSS